MEALESTILSNFPGAHWDMKLDIFTEVIKGLIDNSHIYCRPTDYDKIPPTLLDYYKSCLADSIFKDAVKKCEGDK